jgi:hypothetical protein
MKRIIYYTVLFSLLALANGKSFGQQGLVVAGGEASGTTGSSSFSIGQVFFHSTEHDQGSVNEGIQQPFEIFLSTSTDGFDLSLDFSVFPNPTNQFLNLRIQEHASDRLIFSLYNEKGMLLKSGQVSEYETRIDMSPFSPGMYILNISNGERILGQYKVIKH